MHALVESVAFISKPAPLPYPPSVDRMIGGPVVHPLSIDRLVAGGGRQTNEGRITDLARPLSVDRRMVAMVL